MFRAPLQRNSATLCFLASLLFAGTASAADFFERHCYECHSGSTAEGGLDLAALSRDFSDRNTFARWVKVHDRIQAGEMPPPEHTQPPADERKQIAAWLKQSLVRGEDVLRAGDRTRIRRLTRVEYENTIRDLFGMRLLLQDRLPADGKVHGFDKNSDALSISHVHLAKYLEAADYVLDMAIAVQPQAPPRRLHRLSLSNDGGVSLLASSAGGCVFLKDKRPHPDHPPIDGVHQHFDRAAHKALGMYDDNTVGVFRHEDESFNPRFQSFSAIYPGRYRVRTSLWSFTWDKGEVKPSRGVEAARLSVIQLQDNGRHGGHPSYVLGFFDAPSIDSQVHEFEWWFNPKDCLGFNVSSLAPVHIYHQYKRNQLAFTGPGIACDWLEVEGPLHDIWPPQAHRTLFGELPMVEFDHRAGETTFPNRTAPKQQITGAFNRPEPWQGNWTIHSENPLSDARKLLAGFLRRAFRRPVSEQLVDVYVAQVQERLEAGDCFELAMRWAYRAALCAPDFLYHVEPSGELDDFAFVNRLSYFLWNSMPDERLAELAASGEIRRPNVLRSEVERLLKDEKSQRFIQDFCGQWLRLREIAATDPDRKLYPEFSPYLQNSMVMETEAYFRELVAQDLDATHLIDSDFAMLNEKLAVHYGIGGVSGPAVRRVELPPGSPRGGLLTQAAILKITANGTTTSPVPRGAFVTERLLGQPVDPPPPDVPAVEPDVRGAVTIREQLQKHRADRNCAGCHAKLDPTGFALESFDVIGGYRERYRSIEGDKAERGSIDPFIHVGFRLGPAVDPSYQLPDGRPFADIHGLKKLLAENPDLLASNLVRHLAIYATGRELTFRDRDRIAAIVHETKTGGVRSLIHGLIQSDLFRIR